MTIIQNNNKIHWYELCFHGEEDPESQGYDPEQACSYVIKTEIPPNDMNDQDALDILFGRDDEPWMKELRSNLTCVREIDEEEATFFDIDDLTERVEDSKGIYYTRPKKEKGTNSHAKIQDHIYQQLN